METSKRDSTASDDFFKFIDFLNYWIFGISLNFFRTMFSFWFSSQFTIWFWRRPMFSFLSRSFFWWTLYSPFSSFSLLRRTLIFFLFLFLFFFFFSPSILFVLSFFLTFFLFYIHLRLDQLKPIKPLRSLIYHLRV
jgi:hypothetical protein